MKQTDGRDCEAIQSLLPLHLGRELDDEPLVLVEEHLAVCEACRERAEAGARARDAYRDAHWRVDDPRQADLALDLWPGVRARLLTEGLLGEAAAGSGRGRPWLAGRRRVAAAAAAVLVVALGARFAVREPAPEPSSPAGAALPLAGGTRPLADAAVLVGHDAEGRLRRLDPAVDRPLSDGLGGGFLPVGRVLPAAASAQQGSNGAHLATYPSPYRDLR